MRFVVPISQSDVSLLPKKVLLFKKLGGWKNHHLLLAPTPSCLPDALKAAEDLKETCPNIEVRAINRDPTGGWPKACNDQFVDTVNLLAKIGNTLTWMWFEMDCDPFRIGWQDALETAYNAGNTPFCGHVRLTAEVTTPPLQGSHMIGSGIYPADFHIIAAAEYPFQSRSLPFDINLRWRVIQSGVTNTPLIAHRHSSHNYFRDGGFLKLEDGPQIEIEPAAVVHGCKDGSLMDLILAGELDNVAPVMKSAPAAVPQTLTAPQAPKVSIEVQLINAGYHTPMKGVWMHSTVSPEDIANHFGIQTPTAKKPMSAMDLAIAAAYQSVPQGRPISVFQHGPQGDPETGSDVSPHETLETEASPESGADNVTPPVHIPSGGGEPQGESSEAQSLAVPSGEPQTGQSLLDHLTLRVARHPKPERVGFWAEELQMDKEELKKLINSHPDLGLKIEQAGWVKIAA